MGHPEWVAPKNRMHW